MNRNTSTTFGTLREGDRFYFAGDKLKKTYQVTEAQMFRSTYNEIREDGLVKWLHDKDAPNVRPVIFLRHTRPLFSEECKLSRLADGDVFHLAHCIIKEYQVIKNNREVAIRCINADVEISSMPSDTRVVYIRKKEEVKR